MEKKYIDIFAGCGGLSLGLHNAGWRGVFAVEKNEDAFATLKYNLIDQLGHFEWVDWLEMENHDIDELLKKHREKLEGLRGKVPLVVGGPPCQGFSMAGQRNAKDKRNQLVNSYVKFVELVRPEYIFFENVHGFTIAFKDEKNNNKKGIPASVYIIRKLKKLGYDLKDEIIDFSEYGVPQKRRRFILVGCLNGEAKEFFTILKNNRDDFLEKKGLKVNIPISEAIGDLLKANGEVDCPDCMNFKSGLYGKPISPYERFVRSGINEQKIPDSHRFANHRENTVTLFEKMLRESDRGRRLSGKKDNIPELKKRGVTVLDAQQVCNTITSHPDDYIHYLEPRIMTVRECARIQSFPDWFEFKGKYTTGGQARKLEVPRYSQVGNAIPPLFAEQVGEALTELINRRENGLEFQN
ncbi:MAG: DNA cytosine methyltransferase [Dorea sp.]